MLTFNNVPKLNSDHIDNEAVVTAAIVAKKHPEVLLLVAQQEKEKKIIAFIALIFLVYLYFLSISSYAVFTIPQALFLLLLSILMFVAHKIMIVGAISEKALTMTFIALTTTIPDSPADSTDLNSNNENRD